jgi:hypothetical protein
MACSGKPGRQGSALQADVDYMPPDAAARCTERKGDAEFEKTLLQPK